MVSTQRIKERLKHLLEHFSVQYVKAYKTALVLSIRDAKNAKDIEKIDWQLMIDSSRLVKNPQIEGAVYLGEGFKTKKHWSMAKNYITTETPFEEPKDGAVAPAEGEQKTEGAEGASTDADKKEEDPRIWLDDSCTEVCMNPACGEKFGLLKRRTHCRHCGEIFCSNCTKFKIEKNKFCEPCHTLRTTAADPAALPPVLERPTVKTRMLNFHKYRCELHDSELFAAAGAASASAAAGIPAGAEGKFMLVLSHPRNTRPQFTVAFDAKEDRDKWMGLINSASKWSPSPITQDPVLRKAFTAAYNRTRWYAWVSGSWDIDGTESEMLTDCLYAVLEREIFGAELLKLGNMPRNIARKAICKIIEGGVSAVWATLMKGLDAIRGPLEAAVGEILNPLFETEVKVKNEIKAPIEEAASKGLASAEAKLQEMFASSLPVIAAAGEAELNLIRVSLIEVIDECATDSSVRNFNWKYDWMRWRNDWSYCYKNEPISRMIDAKLRGPDDGAESRELAYDLIGDLKNLNQSAFVTIKQNIPADSDPLQSIRDQYPDIIKRAAHDVTLILETRLIKALDSAIRGPLIEIMNKIVSTLCKPLESMIPSALKDILDPERTAMEIINDVLTNQEKALIRIAIAKVQENIIVQGNTLAEQGLVKA